MAEKKRKETNAVASRPAKKSKKAAAATTAQPAEDKPTEDVPPNATESAKPAKKPRKRAADFLEDEPEATPPKKGKKGSKSTAEAPKLLTADGSNGLVEHSDDEGVTITTGVTSTKNSMMAEAVRTADQELQEEFGGVDEENNDIDLAPALLTGFDSDNDDPAEDKNFDASRTAPIPQFKKTSKKLRQAASKTEEPGVVYVGRVPHGFYEKEMREYFSQFGTITRLRLSRNKKTGASKHFAFVEFESTEVAKIVAETMDNYLMFGHILKCKLVDAEQLHPNTWQGANKRFRKIPHQKLEKEREEKARQNLTAEKIEKKMDKEKKKREKKQQQMKEIGYEYELPELKKPGTSGTPENDEEVKAILPAAETPDVEGALVPPPTVPKDEVAAKVEEKVKKAKKEKKTAAAPAPAPAPTEEPSTKKAKKSKSTVAKEEQPGKEKVAVEEVPAEKSKKVKTTGESGNTIKTEQTISDKKSLVNAAAKGKGETIKPAKKEKETEKGKEKQLKGILKKPKKV